MGDLRVVALGGGHGLAASLAAWRTLTSQLTAEGVQASARHRDLGRE